MADFQHGNKVMGSMYQNCTFIQAPSVIDEITKLISQKNYEAAASVVKTQMNQIGAAHPMYPDFVVDIKKSSDKLVLCSKPLNKDAAVKYPPCIKGRFTLSEKYKDFESLEAVLEYSYESQQDIDINMIELKKMLGDVEDPFQGEVGDIVNKDSQFKILHREFPEAKPFKIKLEGYAESYDYVLLRVYKAESGKAIYMSNKEQNADVLFDVKFNIPERTIYLSTKINPNKFVSHKAKLKYLKFFQNIESKNKLSIVSLEDDEVMSEGFLDKFEYTGPFLDSKDEIKFLKSIILIEKKFNITITIPSKIKESDLEAIYYLKTAIEMGVVRGTWKTLVVAITMKENGTSNLLDLEKDLHNIVHISPMDIEIFGVMIHIAQVKRELLNPKITNKEQRRIHKLIKNGLNDGDIVTVELISGKNNTLEDTFNFDCNDSSYIEIPGVIDPGNDILETV